MEKPDKTVIVVDTPIYNPDGRTVFSFTFSDEGKKLIIESSRELQRDVIVEKLQSRWDTFLNGVSGSHDCTV